MGLVEHVIGFLQESYLDMLTFLTEEPSTRPDIHRTLHHDDEKPYHTAAFGTFRQLLFEFFPSWLVSFVKHWGFQCKGKQPSIDNGVHS